MVKIKVLILVMSFIFAKVNAQQDSIMQEFNNYRKGIGLDTFKNDQRMKDALSLVNEIRCYKEMRGKNEEKIIRKALAKKRIFDADIKIYKIKEGKAAKLSLKDSILSKKEIVNALDDRGYSNLSYYIFEKPDENFINIVLSKRFIDFNEKIPGRAVITSQTHIWKTLGGVSRLTELYCEEINVSSNEDIFNIRPKNKKLLKLDKNNAFSIEVESPEKEIGRFQAFCFFDKNNKIVAYVPFFGF
jgi:hypothetical protein